MKFPNLWRQTVTFLFILIMSGCSTFRFAASPPSLYSEKTTYGSADYKKDRDAYDAKGATPDERTRYRNRIAFKTRKEIDKNYQEFKNSFFGERAATETSLDITQIGLSTAGTFAGGETANLLAALSTGLAGSRLSFNKNFFKEKSPDLLVSRMDALRAEQWSQIYKKLVGTNDDSYSLDEAECDLFEYFDKGSLQAAFQSIIAESGAAKKEAEAEIKNEVRAKYGEFMGSPAPESELTEIGKLYTEYNALKEDAKRNRAKKVLDEFKKKDSTPIPAVMDDDLDRVGYLYSLARCGEYPELRENLIEAFEKAKLSQQ